MEKKKAGRPKIEKPYNRLLNFIVSKETEDSVRAYAAEQKITMSELVRRALKMYMGDKIGDR